MIRSHVLICGGTGCTSSGSKVLMSTFEKELEKNGLQDEVKIVQTGCFGLCALGPVVIIYPEGTFYSRVEEKDVAEIVSEHLLKGRLVDRLVYKDVDESIVEEAGKTVSLNDTNFYKTQKRVALRNCGRIDPENIDEYIAQKESDDLILGDDADIEGDGEGEIDSMFEFKELYTIRRFAEIAGVKFDESKFKNRKEFQEYL